MSNDVSIVPSFSDLDLSEPILKALKDVGYETPSPIQAQIIPFILDGRDVLGQAQPAPAKPPRSRYQYCHVSISSNKIRRF